MSKYSLLTVSKLIKWLFISICSLSSKHNPYITLHFMYVFFIISMQTPCDEGFSAMEDMHRKLIGDLQRQHDEEVAALLKEKDQLLQEETAATMAGKNESHRNKSTVRSIETEFHSFVYSTGLAKLVCSTKS